MAVVHVYFEKNRKTFKELPLGVVGLEISETAKASRMLAHVKVLPRQVALEEVDHDVTKSEKIISSGKLISKMCINADIATCSN